MRTHGLFARTKLLTTLFCYLAWAAVILFGPSMLQHDEQAFDRYLSARGLGNRDSDLQPNSISSHWRFGLDRIAALDDERRQCIRDEPPEPGTQRLSLQPTVERAALLLVPRRPDFNTGMISRQGRAPSRPNSSLLVPGGHGKINCLTTRDPSLRTRSWAEFSLEVVVLFLPNPTAAFGLRGVYQTIVGRNGADFRKGFDAKLASLYLKLSPSRRVLLEAWGADHTYHTLASYHVLKANIWYTIAASSRALPDGGGFLWELRINGQLSGSAIMRVGGLAVPPRHSDGDFTFGCGMFAGVPADPCWCLLNEARIADRSRREDELLYASPGARLKRLAAKSANISSLRRKLRARVGEE